MNDQRLTAILGGADRAMSARMLRAGLAVIEPGYRAAVTARNAMYDRGLRRVVRLPRPVVSVGNITTGGTGKTPMVAFIARWMLDRGVRPGVLMRGYKGGPAGNDEAVLLREELGDRVPVEPDPDRAAAAGRVLDQHPDVRAFILDDGFQHRRIHRDLDLVLIDATRPFGFEHVLPRGLLREPAENLRRANAVVVTRADQVDPQTLAALDQRITALSGKPPTAHVALEWATLRDADGREHPVDLLRGKKVLAVCGIGNPAGFCHALAAHVQPQFHLTRFPDHHHYTAGDVAQINELARQENADALVMTEKDWVKWRKLQAARSAVPVFRPRVAPRFLSGLDKWSTLLAATPT